MLLVKIQTGTGCSGRWHEFKKRSDLQAELLRGNGHVLAIVSADPLHKDDANRLLQKARNEHEANELRKEIADLSDKLNAAKTRLAEVTQC